MPVSKPMYACVMLRVGGHGSCLDHWEGVPALEVTLTDIRRGFIIRHSSVVLSELRRGARTSAARRRVSALYKLAAIQWAPNAEDWWRAGDLIWAIGDAHDWDIAKRREFQNETLIALTARRHGATVVTRNRGDFELLERKLALTVLCL
jgi:predicted nucleic acid-binding protein